MRLLTSALAAAALITTSTAKAVEINDQTSFVGVPTKAKLTNYRWYAFECCATYYVTLDFPEGAGADLGGINLEQIRGAQAAFYYGAVPVKAFIGTPRRQGNSLDVKAEFSDDARSVNVRFASAVLPGDTVTIAFEAGVNPPGDIYTFSLTAIPAGPNPIPQMVGVVQMEIFEPVY
ncbi:secreted protein of unknown function DUF2808 [Synechococcus sp. BIOS-E4-1]|uniref:DUF2808 domain-containing protein n=1 Tax=Synechococcus sp. BIOS-E4-1 TaxID=1400864 RepID=UPI0016486347|nr:DUF2808 domain-containing protein [Synechococcus sp. BIOS-E4-1]QNI55667.1 secreted protein of unknown function DUF2808 [Synechococcus sp. BIOS-E4-1]